MTNLLSDSQEQERLVQYLLSPENGYLKVRILADGSVAAVLDLLYTRAIILGCTFTGYERRFCFEDRSLALARFADLQTEDDVPAGYTARR